MSIRIVEDEFEFVMTWDEHEQLQAEWDKLAALGIGGTFESFVRERQTYQTYDKALPAVSTKINGLPPYKITASWNGPDEIQIVAESLRSK